MPKTKKPQPALMFFFEIKEGDVKKQIAQSNVSRSGGGARDIRIRPADKFTAILEQMFPRKTAREGVWEGTIQWEDDQQQIQHAVIELWRPTEARPNEARIGRINRIEAWEVDSKSYRADLGRGKKWFYLLVKDTDGIVWARLLFEDNLPNEDPRVRRYVEERIKQTNPNHHVRGTLNFITREEYP